MKIYLYVLITINILSSNYSLANALFKTKQRGLITEYDSGPSKDSNWVNLFAETPNYRAFGDAIISGRGEKFRWKMGPMFYRGRLAPESVKVFIIGQEGAQDENLSNRSFTGSTGTRMQKFINYLGINKSYLFMNTFVYTITGQYSLYGDDATNDYKIKQWKQLMWLAQNEDSIIVQHRHRMFNYMLETNKNTLGLVIGVGTAGKESLVTWFNSVSKGSCSYSKLNKGYCAGKGKLKGIVGIGVRHPGAASARNAGSTATGGLIYDFKNKAKIVASIIERDSDWLPEDTNSNRDFSKDFKYGYASIPHRDFPFGTPWTLGKKGTTSNRRGSGAIQIFSKNGCYNNGARINGRCKSIPPNEKPDQDSPDERIHYLYYKNPRNLINKNSTPEGFTQEDIPFEPPKNIITRSQYDLGPTEIKNELMNFYLSVELSEFSNEIIQHKSFGPTGMYRGNSQNPEFLIIADQHGHTDMFSGRALTGTAGQKLQSFLNGSGLQNRYLIIRSLPVDCLDDRTRKLTCQNLMHDRNVTKAREELIQKILKENNIRVVLGIGEHSNRIVKSMKLNQPYYLLDMNSENLTSDFQNLFEKIKSTKLIKSSAEYRSTKIAAIPRTDLPFSSRWWMGTAGDRVARANNMTNVTVQNGRVRKYDVAGPNGDYYKLYAPTWSTNWSLEKSPLNEEENASVRKFKQTFSVE